MALSPEALLTRAMMLLPLPSPTLLPLAKPELNLAAWTAYTSASTSRGGLLVCFEAFAKVLASLGPSDPKYRCGGLVHGHSMALLDALYSRWWWRSLPLLLTVATVVPMWCAM
jgi:hypothetical protein